MLNLPESFESPGGGSSKFLRPCPFGFQLCQPNPVSKAFFPSWQGHLDSSLSLICSIGQGFILFVEEVCLLEGFVYRGDNGLGKNVLQGTLTNDMQV